MHKIDKFLKSLIKKERVIAEQLLKSLRVGDFDNLDIKKLKGCNNLFRVRKGAIRVVYRVNKNKKMELIFITRRTGGTYKNF